MKLFPDKRKYSYSLRLMLIFSNKPVNPIITNVNTGHRTFLFKKLVFT